MMEEIELQDEDTRILANIIYNMKHYLINYVSGLSNTPEDCMTPELNGRLLMAKDALKYLVHLEEENKIYI